MRQAQAFVFAGRNQNVCRSQHACHVVDRAQPSHGVFQPQAVDFGLRVSDRLTRCVVPVPRLAGDQQSDIACVPVTAQPFLNRRNDRGEPR